MSRLKADTELLKRLETINKKVSLLEREMTTIKSWLTEDAMLTPYEKRLVDKSLSKIKTGEYGKLITLEKLRKKLAV